MEIQLYHTSTIFLLNTILALYYGYYLYSLTFLILCLSSICTHMTNDDSALLIDKIAIYLIVLQGGLMLLDKYKKLDMYIIFILFTFVFCIYIYHYGYCTNQYVFSKDKIYAKKYHALMHIIGSLGHCAIILY